MDKLVYFKHDFGHGRYPDSLALVFHWEVIGRLDIDPAMVFLHTY